MENIQRIQELTDLLNDANYRYYVLDDPQMLDFEYAAVLRDRIKKEKISDVVIDLAIENSVSDTDKVKDNFGLGSKLLERINEKIRDKRRRSRDSL